MKYTIIGSSVKQEKVLEILLSGKACAEDASINMAKTIFQDLMLSSNDMAYVDVIGKTDMVSRLIVTIDSLGKTSVIRGKPIASHDFIVKCLGDDAWENLNEIERNYSLLSHTDVLREEFKSALSKKKTNLGACLLELKSITIKISKGVAYDMGNNYPYCCDRPLYGLMDKLAMSFIKLVLLIDENNKQMPELA